MAIPKEGARDNNLIAQDDEGWRFGSPNWQELY